MKNHRRASAFTLLEVLVASAVLAIVMVILLGTLSTTLALWRNTESKIVADREARSAELLLAQDLSSVVMPGNSNLWPRVLVSRSGRDNVYYLRFLTSRPPSYLTNGGAGDVFYVEYAVLPSTNTNTGAARELRRYLMDSRDTYNSVLRSGSFPAVQPAGAYQALGFYLLPTNKMAARGLKLATEANDTNFIVLGTNMLPLTSTNYNPTNNRPAAIEVNFAVADPDTLANTNLMANPNFVLRNAGLYSTRFFLPPPPSP
jgi:prepilin-type N-terminal cleavage/methylation domain-containing protein